MKSAAFIIPFLTSFVAAKYLSFLGSNQQVLSDPDREVPGENPLKFCANIDKPILTIDHVDLSPNPPKPGTNLIIEAKGTFNSKVIEGAYIQLTVRYGLITLLRQTADLCKQMKNVDEDCPLDGEKILRKEVSLPAKIPPGTYTVFADVYTVDDESVICLEATVVF